MSRYAELRAAAPRPVGRRPVIRLRDMVERVGLLVAWLGMTCSTADGHAAAGHVATAPARLAYEVLDLGAFMAREIDERPGLNNQAHVASWTVIAQTRVAAMLVHPVQGHQDVSLVAGLPAGRNSLALGINDRGQYVGMLESPDDLRDTQPFAYVDAAVQILPTLGGRAAAARAVNDTGLIVGSAQDPERHTHAVAWKNGAMLLDLGMLQGGHFSRASAVNAKGEIAGESNVMPNGKSRAVAWRGGKAVDLGLLPGGTFSSALDLNNKGVAVGYADDSDGGSNAVRFIHGNVESLGTLGDEPSSALGVNDNGVIVGSSAVSEGKMRAFVWKAGHLYNLNDLIPHDSGWLLLSAYRINSRGEILAYGFYHGSTHLCLLITKQNRWTVPAHAISPALQSQTGF